MEGFDDVGVFFSDNFNPDTEGGQINLQAVKKKFKEFIRTFNEDNFHYKYRFEEKFQLLRRFTFPN